MALTIEPRDLVWNTRGTSWDYDFISWPDEPEVDVWQGEQDAILGADDPAAERIHWGRYVKNGRTWPFVAVRCYDPDRSDRVRRRIQHFLIWFPQGLEEVASLRDHVPSDWHHQWIRHAAAFLPRDETFDLSSERVDEWGLHRSLAATINERVKELPPLELSRESNGHSTWDAEERVREIGAARDEASSTGRSKTLSPLIVLIAVLGLFGVVLAVTRSCHS